MILYDDISDHLPCMVDCHDVMASLSEDKMTWKRIFDTKHIKKLQMQLTEVNWDDELQHLDANKGFKYL